jgi:hypothetical protein
MSLLAKEIDLTSEFALRIGDSCKIRFAIKYNGFALNLTGATAICLVKRYWDGPAILGPTITFFDRVLGIVDLNIDKQKTNLMLPVTYRYAIQLTMPDGTIYTPVYGKLEFQP